MAHALGSERLPVPTPTSTLTHPSPSPNYRRQPPLSHQLAFDISAYCEHLIAGNISPLPPHFLGGAPIFFPFLTLNSPPNLFWLPWAIVVPKRSFKQELNQRINRKLTIQAPLPRSFVRICHEAGITVPCELVDGSVLLDDEDAISQLSSVDFLESGSSPFPGHWLGGTSL